MNRAIFWGLLALFGGSIWYAVKGIKVLIKLKKWNLLIGYVIFITSYPVVLNIVYQIENGHLRLWAAVPTVFAGFIWFTSGYLLNGFVEKISVASHRPYQGFDSDKSKVAGGILFLFGAGIWYYGAFHPELVKFWQKGLLITSMIFVFFGLSKLLRYVYLQNKGEMPDNDFPLE
ncbi:MAG: hypothetical protein ACOX4L_06235 [Bacillota bacterium]